MTTLGPDEKELRESFERGEWRSTAGDEVLPGSAAHAPLRVYESLGAGSSCSSSDVGRRIAPRRTWITRTTCLRESTVKKTK